MKDLKKVLLIAAALTMTVGNVSAIDRKSGLVAIKPSGVSYSKLTPDDIVKIAPYVLRHRLILSPKAKVSGVTAEKITSKILNSVGIPT